MRRDLKIIQLLVILLLAVYPLGLPAATPPPPAQPSQYVVDLAGVLNPDTQARLNTSLRDLEAQTTAQVVILTLQSLEGEPIESFSHRTAVQWGIGQKGKDNGVLVTVAVKDHKYRIEVGYGLESVLPDSLVGSLGRDYLVPNFRKGAFAAGLAALTDELIRQITDRDTGGSPGEAETTAAAPAPETPPQPETPSQLPLVLTILAVIVLLPALALIVPRLIWRRRKGGGSSGGFWSSSSGSSSSWSDSDSGFSSGGDFGGGGASGDW